MVMFSDLVGSTALAADLDPEDLREVLLGSEKCAAETVGRFGGIVAPRCGQSEQLRQDVWGGHGRVVRDVCGRGRSKRCGCWSRLRGAPTQIAACKSRISQSNISPADQTSVRVFPVLVTPLS
jgi:class 3 adenylate cyclase